MHAVVLPYIWSTTQSLAVVTVYHSAFDEVRDILEGSIGFGPLAEYWQAVVLTVLGAVVLWKAKGRKPLAMTPKMAAKVAGNLMYYDPQMM